MFTTPLDLRAYIADEWVVLNPLVWEYGGERITVPRGFITDLASIPRALRGLPNLDPNGLSRAPAVLHDFLYCSQTVESRAVADGIFRAALQAVGVGAVTRTVPCTSQ